MNPQRISRVFAWMVTLAGVGRLLAVSWAAEASPIQIERVLAFATSNQVRFEIRFRGPPASASVRLEASITDESNGSQLWHGSIETNMAGTGVTRTVSHAVGDLHPKLWSPLSPTLYRLQVTPVVPLAAAVQQKADIAAQASTRFGFRSMEIRNGQFHLNGRPVFLRGIAINPPGRTIPDTVGESRAFAEAYVRYLKAQNVNIFRISTDDSQVWFDVCDELGMMLYAGRYGSPPEAEEGKRAAPADYARTVAGYKKLFEGYVSHPSIVMYYLANELPVSGARGAAFSALLTKACDELKQWDPTRPYIGNAGYGEGREGDVCDVHRYWGWYYSSFLTYYNLRDRLVTTPLFGRPERNQPLTFTECVGSFTGSSGEFNVVRSKQLAPRLGWVGHTPEPRTDALDYQCFMVQQATEAFRRLRPLNPRLAGIMPFSIFFYNWAGISSFDQMQPKPAMEQLRLSYQPVLLSWESWTPNAYAGQTIRPFAHIINDAEDGSVLDHATLEYEVVALNGEKHCSGTVKLPWIRYFDTHRQRLQLGLPEGLQTGRYRLSGVVVREGRIISSNSTSLFVAGQNWLPRPARLDLALRVFDPAQNVTAAIRKTGLDFTSLAELPALDPAKDVLVLGDGGWDGVLGKSERLLRNFVQRGGRVVCLSVPPVAHLGWLPEPINLLSGSANDPAYPPKTRPFAEQMNVNPERPNHPVFNGLDRHHLSLWSDDTSWDESQPGFPRVYPVTAGFRLERPESLARTSVLADYDRGLEGVALCEMFDGTGSVLVSGFDLDRANRIDPCADRLLFNLLTYAASAARHDPLPLVEKPVHWGDFPSEQGLVCGSLNGLLVNTEWISAPHGPKTTPLAANSGAWNMRPGDQFIPLGRNPYGPFGYSTASSLKDLKPDSPEGSGVFWARIPAGRTRMLTRVKNPAPGNATLQIALNEGTPAPHSIRAAETVEISSILPAGAERLSVRYSGPKSLVLLETRFE